MELEFRAYGRDIQVCDIGRPAHLPAGHSKGVVFVGDVADPLGEVYDNGGGVITASVGGTALGAYDTVEDAAKAVVRTTFGVDRDALPEVVARTAAEHLAWCKQRALEYVNAGDLGLAAASIVSDIGKHDNRDDPIAPEMQMLLAAEATRLAAYGDVAQFRRFIEGFAGESNDQDHRQ